ncbi:NADPH oxidase organizer 1 [Anolis sagrei]|uniref:NADPH oxidase organizer 1 n=1 Tax=Anolis sagrei TaxID=38937 RepID=UPI003521C4E5
MNPQRFPLEVKAMALLKHGKEKICMFSVSWSDQNVILIYRAFEEFRKLHETLKRKFPIERGLLRNSDRTIPKFPGIHGIVWKKQKGSQCLKNLKQMEVYCQEILKTKPQISQGEDVVRFFEARSQDLDPDFPQNSSITFPSETGGGQRGPLALSITEPIVCPTFACVAPFETIDLKDRPFRALREEGLEVLLKDRTGWWLVENNCKQLAWFPASFLEETEDGTMMEEDSEEGLLYYLTESYEAQEEDELSVKSGVLVEALKKPDRGWWLVWYNGERGYVPSAFLQPYRNPHRKFLAMGESQQGEAIGKPQNFSGMESSRLSLGKEAPDSVDPPRGSPLMPPRPSIHEMLQRCSAVTKRALQLPLPSAWN